MDWGKCVETVRDNTGKVIGDKVATLDCIPQVFTYIVSALLMFVGLTALVIFIVGGFKFMRSGGDAKQLEGARNNLVFGALGLFIVLFSFFIINVIAKVTGVPCITQFGFGCQ